MPDITIPQATYNQIHPHWERIGKEMEELYKRTHNGRDSWRDRFDTSDNVFDFVMLMPWMRQKLVAHTIGVCCLQCTDDAYLSAMKDKAREIQPYLHGKDKQKPIETCNDAYFLRVPQRYYYIYLPVLETDKELLKTFIRNEVDRTLLVMYYDAKVTIVPSMHEAMRLLRYEMYDNVMDSLNDERQDRHEKKRG